MSEQINKLLCTVPQSFTTAEQKIGRDNIGAMGAVDMSAYVPFSAISSDTASAITSINGSSVGAGFTGLSADSNFTGNGTTASALGLNTAIDITRGVYSSHWQYSNLQFGDDSGRSGTFDREAVRIKNTASTAEIKADGINVNGAVDVALSNTSNAWHPSGLYIREANGYAGTATMDSNQLNIVARGFRGSPLSSYSAHISEMKASSLSFTYEHSDSSKESALLSESALKFSANDTANTAYIPTATYGRSGAEFRSAGQWSLMDSQWICFGTGGENSSEYIDNGKIKSYDAVHALMSSMSAWATAQGWTPT